MVAVDVWGVKRSCVRPYRDRNLGYKTEGVGSRETLWEVERSDIEYNCMHVGQTQSCGGYE